MRIKICGITRPEDAVLAARLGADAIGLNFYPKSPRCITPTQAAEVARAVPPFLMLVGLWVQEPLDNITSHLQNLPFLGAVQYHGDATPLPPRGIRFIPAFPVRDLVSLRTIEAYLEFCQAAERMPAGILVDAHVAGLYGGTGQTAPWELLAEFHPGVPLILAGGLTPENVAEAVRLVRPYAVDVASGVESSPGIKDPVKMQQFIEAARLA